METQETGVQRPPDDLRLDTDLATDRDTVSDEERADGVSEEIHSAIGVSIGRQQTRLTSPTTPAVEKAAAIEQSGGFFGGSFDGVGIDETIAEDDDGTTLRDEEPQDTATARRASDISPSRLAPQQSEQKHAQRSSWNRLSLLEGVFSPRKRASSGPEASTENRQKTFKDSISAIPKHFSITSPFLSSSHDVENVSSQTSEQSDSPAHKSTDQAGQSSENVPHAQATASNDRVSFKGATSTRPQDEEPLGSSGHTYNSIADLPTHPQLHKTRQRPSYLRRATSDISLHRTLSKVSSLGDDSRWDDVSEQVNSRFKAIKDSLQDSRISLPSISNLSISSFTPDFLLPRERTSTAHRRSVHDTSRNIKPLDPMTRRPYPSAKAAFTDTMADKSTHPHPHFNQALEELEGDVVVLGGYRGSILRSAEPPHRQLWVPIKVGLNLRKVDLEVGINEGDDEKATDTIFPDGMLSHIGPVDISRRLLKRMRTCENGNTGKLRVHDWGYDWRLHPHHLSKKLIEFLESLQDNQPDKKKGAIVIAHSLGGLITRHAVNQRPDLFKGVVYAGVPQTCVNILGPLRNGDEVLLSSRVLTAQVNFTIRTSFALLPLEGICFFDKNTQEQYPVDFFDPQTWIDYRLSPCVARPLPPLISQPKSSGITGYVANALPSLPLPGRSRGNSTRSKSPGEATKPTTAGGMAGPNMTRTGIEDSDLTAGMENGSNGQSASVTDAELSEIAPSVRTAVTIPRDEAVAYLTRTLATVKQFKKELAFNPAHHEANVYPPIALIYGKSTPTVFGAKVDGREGIKHADAYDDLAFASGDGVVLARAAMAPEGYRVARRGIVSSERGHVTLLGDLEAVGKCLLAVTAARRRGVGEGR